MRLPFLCLCTNAVLSGLDWVEPYQQALGVTMGEVALPDFDAAHPGNHGALSLLGASGAARAPLLPTALPPLKRA